jgi:hypothetical protein
MKISDFLPNIMGDLPSCPDETARIAVVRALQRLCERSKAWAAWVDPILLQDGNPTYDIDPPQGALTLFVREVWCGGRQLTGQDQTYLERTFEPGATAQAPLFFNTGARQTVTVYPTPDAPTDSLRVKAVFQPVLAATSIPDDIALYHGALLEAGAKGALMLQPKKPWSDPQLGAYWTGIFNTGVEAASIDTEHGNVPASTFVRPRAFG